MFNRDAEETQWLGLIFTVAGSWIQAFSFPFLACTLQSTKTTK